MNTQEIKEMSISQIRRMMSGETTGEDVLVFSGNDCYTRLYGQAVRVEGLAISVCTAGEAVAVIQQKEYRMTRGAVCIRTSGMPALWEDVSDDYDGFEMIVSMDYLKSLPFDMKNIATALAYLRGEHHFHLEEERHENFVRLFELAQAMSGDEDYYKVQSLQGVVVSLLYLVCDVVHKAEEGFEKIGRAHV